MHFSLNRTFVAATAALLLSVVPVWAEDVKFAADLKGASEVPANDAAGTGKVEATLDTETKALTWNISYEGLTGEATGAHFHGPAKEDATADPVVAIEGTLVSPYNGNATLTDAQIADLQAGLWYFNVHTAQYPDGELRGQVLKSAM